MSSTRAHGNEFDCLCTYTIDFGFLSKLISNTELPVNIQENCSLSEFKCCLTNNDITVTSYCYSGKRMEQINHCRLRFEMNDLNSEHFNRHLTDNP